MLNINLLWDYSHAALDDFESKKGFLLLTCNHKRMKATSLLLLCLSVCVSVWFSMRHIS